MGTHVVSCVRLPGAVLAMLMMFFANGAHAQSPIVINEIMADNGTALDNAGDFPDWIELLNITGVPVDLADWSLTDAPTLVTALSAPPQTSPEAVVAYPNTKDVQIVFDGGDVEINGAACKEAPAEDRVFHDAIVTVD